MQPRDQSYLLDILTASQLIQAFVADMDRETFDNDVKTQSAVIRQLEIIGEATKRLSDECEPVIQTFPGGKWLACVIFSSMPMTM